MKPDDNRPANSIAVPTRDAGIHVEPRNTQAAQTAAANIARGQIDSAYQNNPNTAAPAQPATPERHGAVDYQPASLDTPSPYEQTHDESKHTIEPNVWQRYHSAWQNYYQQYYERYYMSEVDKTKRALEESSHQVVPREPEVFTKDEALYDLRSKLLDNVRGRAQKIRKSRHFVPIIAALVALLIPLALQYNREAFAYFAAYVAPGSLDQESLETSATSTVATTKDDRVIIPKLSINVPIIWDAVASDQTSLNHAMDQGAAWFNVVGANSRPGQNGNSVYSAHSSNDWTDQGNYKFAFAPLVKTKEGDMIYINYQGTRYAYTVTHTKTVQPTDVAALNEGTDKPYITLITCVPLGTALNRLLVFADQVSPDPKAATAKPTQSTSSHPTTMPRNSPTFFERVFGIGG